MKDLYQFIFGRSDGIVLYRLINFRVKTRLIASLLKNITLKHR